MRISSIFNRESGDRIAVLHLHGVENGKDHRPPTRLSGADVKSVPEILKGFSASLSLEVFSYGDLLESLYWLEKTVPA
jgi:hypothetical protein